MSDLLSSLLTGGRPAAGRRRRGAGGLADGILEAGQAIFGQLLEPPRWHGFDAVALLVGDGRREAPVPLLMGLGGDRPDGVLATILDLRPGESVLAAARSREPSPGSGGVLLAPEVTSARVEAAIDAGRAVGRGDPAAARSREESFSGGISRNLVRAEGAEREMLSYLRNDVRHGMSLGEAFAASVAEYRSAHMDEPRGVAMLASRLLRADVGIGALDPAAVAVESSLRLPSLAVRAPSMGREDDGWERKPWR